jgi:hypothetical protein
MSRLTRAASCVAKDSRGNRYRIGEYQEMVRYASSGGVGESPGWKSLQTSDGNPVNYISKGHYKLVFPEIELTSEEKLRGRDSF